ncbi:hypothetical protein FSP39_019897 [Pinctada imbricata]|uniref:CAP N-terminal domain-containing protein n=1 Tax=Pinctada imbricata TaxID=66713 RepID=A0AA89BMP7_PINIB|nr:hypothetical protein FSP39_019897 [Pinctada imbricata]
MFCCCPDEVDSDDNNTFQDKKSHENPTDNGKLREDNIKEVPREIKEVNNPQTEEIQEGSSSLDSLRPIEGKLDTPCPKKDSIELINQEVLIEEEIMSSEALSSAVNRLEAVASRLEALAGRPGGPSRSSSVAEDALSPSVIAYDGEINEPLGKFMDLSNQIGGDVKTMASIKIKKINNIRVPHLKLDEAGMVQKTFSSARDILIIASKSKKPDDDLLGKLLKPLSEAINETQQYREKNRPSPQFNHLSAVSEAIPAMGWVSVAPTPGPYVKEMQDAGMFYTNRILKEFKEKDQKHVDWVKAWMSIFRILQAYIKQHHTTGLTWNPQNSTRTSIVLVMKSCVILALLYRIGRRSLLQHPIDAIALAQPREKRKDFILDSYL